MKNVNYEKPSMKFVDLRSKQQIAAADGPCMPKASQGNRKFYYDWPGDGWVQITTQGTNCNAKIESIVFIDNENIAGVADAATQKAAIAEARKAVESDKQAFAGAVYGEPDPSWS